MNPKLDIENGVEFGQINDGHMKSLQGFVTVGPKKVEGTSAAIGNTANVDVKGGVLVEGNQKNYRQHEISRPGRARSRCKEGRR